jgi:nitrile hydratase accessory protein
MTVLSQKEAMAELLLQDALPLLKDNEETLFKDGWEAQAFAIGNLLIRNDFITSGEWIDIFSSEIRKAQAQGDPDRGDTYYAHWMTALERLVVERGLTGAQELRNRQWLWKRAKDNTPHGVAISLAYADHAPDLSHDHGNHHHDHDHDEHDDCDMSHSEGHHHHHGPPDIAMIRPLSVCKDRV